MDQLTLGDELRNHGMAVATANSDPQLVKAVDAAIEVCAGRYPLFTADHVRDLVTSAWATTATSAASSALA